MDQIPSGWRFVLLWSFWASTRPPCFHYAAVGDGWIAMLGVEQLDDEHKKEYCELQFDDSDDKKKAR